MIGHVVLRVAAGAAGALVLFVTVVLCLYDPAALLFGWPVAGLVAGLAGIAFAFLGRQVRLPAGATTDQVRGTRRDDLGGRVAKAVVVATTTVLALIGIAFVLIVVLISV